MSAVTFFCERCSCRHTGGAFPCEQIQTLRVCTGLGNELRRHIAEAIGTLHVDGYTDDVRGDLALALHTLGAIDCEVEGMIERIKGGAT